MGDDNFDLNNINWEEIIPILHTFTDRLIKAKKWFRGANSDSYIAGKEVKDYVYEAIARFLEEPDKFRPEDGSFIKYLKFNLVRSLVGADIKKMENRLTSNVVQIYAEYSENEESTNAYEESIGQYTEALFDDEIDFKAIMVEVEGMIAEDSLLENIYLGVKVMNLKRREVINEFGISEKDYDNGIRRLDTILNKVAKKYNL